ncbi:unnamed protein product [Caenorhabditis auriculariae]|uniref:Uncharacterized protein n=1 Tax=Caenorhabditis auriculariae TaxID=2777116 RepID=A0A8S1HR80_9PELO|nr:unnamed protein product [Caenorhabditis auriculariae]
MELSLELITVVSIASFCVVSSVLCVTVWLCRWRRDQVRHIDEKDEPRLEMRYLESKNTTKPPSTTFEKSTRRKSEQKETSSSQKIGDAFPDETIAQSFHPFVTFQKRIDTISDITVSNDSLQRNDSKVNVFKGDRQSRSTSDAPDNEMPDEEDLNPGLNNSINLEVI